MKVLIIGGNGMLGHKLIQVLKKDFNVFSTIRSDIRDVEKYNLMGSEKVFDKIDVENFESVENILKKIKPENQPVFGLINFWLKSNDKNYL